MSATSWIDGRWCDGSTLERTGFGSSVGVLRAAEGGKTGSLMAWRQRFRKAYRLYRTIGFIALIPVVLYEVFAQGAPKVILISIPIFIGFAWVSYETLKRTWIAK
jgi:hypothetical protein